MGLAGDSQVADGFDVTHRKLLVGGVAAVEWGGRLDGRMERDSVFQTVYGSDWVTLGLQPRVVSLTPKADQ